MSIEKRPVATTQSSPTLGQGIYLAKVVSVLDRAALGSLEVTLQRTRGNTVGDDNQSYVVRCAMPFFGSTPFEFMGYNKADYNDTQKSYGMWFVPPDVGVTVLVCFVDGNPGEGYWLACVPDKFVNFSVPGLASTTNVESPDKKYGSTRRLPTGEVNRRADTQLTNTDIDKVKKPVHPIADRLLEAGLIDDDIRGTHNSSARRNVPSSVFGISSPGPVDKRSGAKKATVGKILSKTNEPVPVSRLGGTQFVMDDGDEQFVRKTPASTGPVQYQDVLNGQRGEVDIPYGESFRIRTRTGHQILLHNSEDLIYIGNARGTSWVELSSNGKIDIFAEDSISVHTKNDLNIRADRDINIEAGRNINMKATAEYQDPASLYNDKSFTDANQYESGRIQIESVQNFNLLIGRNGKIHLRNDEQTQGNLDVKVQGNMRLSVQDKDQAPTFTSVETANNKQINLAAQPEGIKGLHIYSAENIRIKTDKNLDLNTLGNNAFTSGANTDILSSGNHTETAARIDMNGPRARTAEIADIADKIAPLNLHINPITNKDLDWSQKKYLEDEPLQSIMRRIPMHEPWVLHENQAPQVLTPKDTDREA
jgi:hypothetical protein